MTAINLELVAYVTMYIYVHVYNAAKVWNTRPGGLVVFAPPCSTWIFLSSAVTGRKWSKPEGNGSKCVTLANVFILRMIYICVLALKVYSTEPAELQMAFVFRI